MKTPSLLIGMALCFWGWQIGLPWIGLALGAAIELSRVLTFRLDLAQQDFQRLWNVCILLLLGVGLFVFIARDGFNTVNGLMTNEDQGGRPESLRQISQTVLFYLQWFPLALSPFILAHAYSQTGALPWSTFSILYRRREARRESESNVSVAVRRTVHPSYPYFILVVLCASTTRNHASWYLAVLALIFGWALWNHRPQRYSWLTWASVLLVATGLAYLGERGLNQVRALLLGWEADLMQQFADGAFDQERSMTRLGGIGRTQQSGRIALRVYPLGDAPPNLLGEAAFNQFRHRIWSTRERDFGPVFAEPDSTTWRLGDWEDRKRAVAISRYTRAGEANLAVPAGIVAFRDLTAILVETNRMGAARVGGAPKLLRYQVDYGPGRGFQQGPQPEDLGLDALSTGDHEAILQMATNLGLAQLSSDAAIEVIRNFFLKGFRYSRWQPEAIASGAQQDAIAAFLREHRSGHCEYFATATTLLLRSAGIPTRYAVGYSLQEARGDHYLVRNRDAHAWCLAYVQGRWLEVDNTPGEWNAVEAEQAGFWEPLYDWLSDRFYAFHEWRQSESRRIYVFGLGIAVLAFLGWRQLRGSRWRRALEGNRTNGRSGIFLGLDSEFYELEKVLGKRYAPRGPSETVQTWIRRLQSGHGPELQRLNVVVSLHYRYRFDPVGLTGDERSTLRQAVRSCLAARP